MYIFSTILLRQVQRERESAHRDDPLFNCQTAGQLQLPFESLTSKLLNAQSIKQSYLIAKLYSTISYANVSLFDLRNWLMTFKLLLLLPHPPAGSIVYCFCTNKNAQQTQRENLIKFSLFPLSRLPATIGISGASFAQFMGNCVAHVPLPPLREMPLAIGNEASQRIRTACKAVQAEFLESCKVNLFD